MYAGIAINFALLILLNGLALASAFFLPPGIAVLFLYLSLPCLCYYIFNNAGLDGGRFNRTFNFTAGIFLFHIALYAVLFWKSGLLFAGAQTTVSFWDALYFSVTTWSTTGYGDFSPAPSVRLVASSESLLGIFSMGIYIAIVSNWIAKRTEERARMMAHNRKIIEEAWKKGELMNPKPSIKSTPDKEP